ncbi:hypothetical protein N0V93_009701 [Gnomoniopsis smithogilvyi]|uniref:Aminoglycoside phosphotransferase domain-containing protein n=1 Tax=Gnomoniopsis smithogilvyi TaxID=1191159 RepID=A0A9W9CTX4_9PEZI|nr:hypothetical protein N0V93_009701 [Gnomoniopsis smithogilvyi]
MVRDSQDGLEWDHSGLDLVPKWTREPSLDAIESVCRQQLGLKSEDSCTVSFFASGLFNKLYLISTSADPVLMRVSLPVHPRHKTLGEVATLQWVRDNTDIPVPKVIAFQDTNENEIGFEWMLMNLMPGKPAYRRWRTMSMTQKVAFTERIAEYQAQLFRCGDPDTTFRNIGTLEADFDNEIGGVPKTFTPGQMISHEFFMGDHIHYDVPRGPFRSSHDWLSAELNLVIHEQTTALEKADNEQDKEDAEEILGPAKQLLALLPQIFPATQDSPEVTVIYHDDLNLNNILVDDEGNITAVVDWECVSALPLWMSVQMPKFLIDGGEGGREDEPIRENYADETPPAPEDNSCADGLDDEGKTDLYWIHLMEYEVTQLQKVYNARLKQLWPDRPVDDSLIKVDFLQALYAINAEFFLGKVTNWVDRVGRGENIRWLDVFK